MNLSKIISVAEEGQKFRNGSWKNKEFSIWIEKGKFFFDSGEYVKEFAFEVKDFDGNYYFTELPVGDIKGDFEMSESEWREEKEREMLQEDQEDNVCE